MGGWKLAGAAVGDLGLDRLRAVDEAIEFGTAEGDDGQPADGGDDDEGSEGFHVFGGASMTLADCSALVKHLSQQKKDHPRASIVERPGWFTKVRMPALGRLSTGH